jgi:hypothetical protein
LSPGVILRTKVPQESSVLTLAQSFSVLRAVQDCRMNQHMNCSVVLCKGVRNKTPVCRRVLNNMPLSCCFVFCETLVDATNNSLIPSVTSGCLGTHGAGTLTDPECDLLIDLCLWEVSANMQPPSERALLAHLGLDRKDKVFPETTTTSRADGAVLSRNPPSVSLARRTAVLIRPDCSGLLVSSSD